MVHVITSTELKKIATSENGYRKRMVGSTPTILCRSPLMFGFVETPLNSPYIGDVLFLLEMACIDTLAT